MSGRLIECDTLADLEGQLAAAGERLVCVYFTAPWCGPCKGASKAILEIAAEEKEVLFLKVDGSEMEEAIDRYGVTVMPTFVFLRSGAQLDLHIGGGHMDTFKEKLGKLKTTPAPAHAAHAAQAAAAAAAAAHQRKQPSLTFSPSTPDNLASPSNPSTSSITPIEKQLNIPSRKNVTPRNERRSGKNK